MALVERLCQIPPEEPGGEPYDRHIALNPFCGALYSILGGYDTIAQVKAYYAMTLEDETEFDIFVARVTAYPVDSVARMLAVHRVRSILTFWEQGDISTYDTVAGIRNHLNNV